MSFVNLSLANSCIFRRETHRESRPYTLYKRRSRDKKRLSEVVRARWGICPIRLRVWGLRPCPPHPPPLPPLPTPTQAREQMPVRSMHTTQKFDKLEQISPPPPTPPETSRRGGIFVKTDNPSRNPLSPHPPTTPPARMRRGS
jgi:hypothetical protein